MNYVQQQQEATGVVPDEKTLVLERFKDELGDWRVVLHSPYGRGVNARGRWPLVRVSRSRRGLTRSLSRVTMVLCCASPRGNPLRAPSW